MNGKEVQRFLEMVQENDETFRGIPIVWKVVKKGADFKVRKGGKGICVELNIRGRSMLVVMGNIRKALKHAKDIYSGHTRACRFSSEAEEGRKELSGKGLVDPDWERKVKEEEARREIPIWKEGMGEIFENWDRGIA